MAKNDSSKSKAELYREERKARIAKAAKKNSKSAEVRSAAARVAKKVVAVVLVVAIVGFIGWKLIDNLGVVEKVTTAMTVGDEKISTASFNYYYTMQYQQTNYLASYYSENYGMSMGYDASKAPDEQTTTDADGNTISWSERFRTSAIEQAQYLIANYEEAVKAGYTLTDDEKAEIDETVATYTSNAETNHFSLNAYLRSTFGGGFTEKVFRHQLEMEAITQRYVSDKESQMMEDITEEAVAAEYEANRKNYDYVDLTYFGVNFTSLVAEDGETEEALAARQEAKNKETADALQAVFDGITDKASFIAAVKTYKETGAENTAEDTDYTTALTNAQYSAVSGQISEAGADWAFDVARRIGDKAFFTDDNGAYIVWIDNPIHTMNSVSVRHCLIMFNAADEDNVTDEEKAAAREKADALYQEWLAGDKTEASFITMTTENSEDTGVSENNGLYANIRITDSYVKPFLDWSFAAGRKAGDSGIIESDYGYHIMYFVSDNTEDLDWKATIRTNLGSAAYDEYSETLVADDGAYAVDASDYWTNYVAKEFCDKIRRNLAVNG